MMMRLLLAVTVTVLVIFSLVSSCHGLANPIQTAREAAKEVQEFISTVQGPGYNFVSSPSPPLSKSAAALLNDLNIKASTEPALAKIQRAQQIPNLLTASLPTLFRLASGVFADGYQIKLVPRDDSKYAYIASDTKQTLETGVFKIPIEPIIIYEFEACPFCRKVREACSMLSLPVTFRPCPKNGPTFRPEIKKKYGSKATFPFMIDPNNGSEMFESDKIIRYLFKVYGETGEVPQVLQGSWVPVTAGLSVSLARLGAGGVYQLSNARTKAKVPLELWAYEGSPFCKIVREKLCSLELEHTVIHTPRGSENRERLWNKLGRFQVPWLLDRNTGVSLFESEAIVEYLDKQYGIEPSPVAFI